MNEQQQKFEKWAMDNRHPEGGYHLEKTTSGAYINAETRCTFRGWQAALASQSPKEAMSDAEIMNIAVTIRPEDHQFKSGEMDFHSYDLALSRAILAASGPNAALVSALEKIIAMNVQYAIDRYDDAKMAETMGCVVTARAALAAVGVEP